jgi:hypothetical protein
MTPLPTLLPPMWIEVTGVHVGGCVNPSDRRFGGNAHAHTGGEFKGWICLRKQRQVLDALVDGKPSPLMFHEYAHVLTGRGHDDLWRKKMLELGQRIEKRYVKKPRPPKRPPIACTGAEWGQYEKKFEAYEKAFERWEKTQR